jgi:hypothetical protein
MRKLRSYRSAVDMVSEEKRMTGAHEALTGPRTSARATAPPMEHHTVSTVVSRNTNTHHDTTQPPRAAAALGGFCANRIERIARELNDGVRFHSFVLGLATCLDLDTRVSEERSVLRDETPAHVREDPPQVIRAERHERRE